MKTRKNGMPLKSVRIALAVLAVAAFAFLAGCDIFFGGPLIMGSGVPKTESRNVSGFDRIEVKGSGRIVASVGGKESLSLTADDNIMPHIKTYVSGRTLVIEPEFGFSYHPITVVTCVINANTIRGISISGSGTASFTGLTGDLFDVDVSGSADITASGSVVKQTVRFSGTGNYSAGGLNAQDTTISISGTGNARVVATNYLSVIISGTGFVDYTGNPDTISQIISGTGRIRPY
jgi:hypothetical protein